MTERTDAGSNGGIGDNGGTDFGNQVCPDGAYITKIYGKAAGYVDQIHATCSDGTELPGGGRNNTNPFTFSNGPFNAISTAGGRYLDNIGGSGGGGGSSKKTLTCPAGHYFVGMYGKAGDWVNKLGFTCGVNANEYCVNNLEHPMCTNISAAVLNKACANKMSPTCVNRKNELSESVINTYCTAHPNEDFCSCYAPAPSYIPPEISGLGKCWNQTCALKGYIPTNMRTPCPNIKICKQSIPLAGDSNILTGNVNVQDCSDNTTTVGAATTPSGAVVPTQGAAASMGTAAAVNAVVKATDAEKSSNTQMYLVIIVAILLGALLISQQDDQPAQPAYQQPYQQPYGQPMSPYMQ